MIFGLLKSDKIETAKTKRTKTLKKFLNGKRVEIIKENGVVVSKKMLPSRP